MDPFNSFEKAIVALVGSHAQPSLWRRLRAAFATPPPVQQAYLWLVLVGGRGAESAQAILRRDSVEWTVEDGIARNAKEIMLTHAPMSAHWMIFNDHGYLLYEGRLRSRIQEATVPAGTLKIVERLTQG